MVALFVFGATQAADDITLGLGSSDIQTWWGASWDADTQTMTAGAWKGLSWYWYAGVDLTYYEEVQINITPAATGAVQIVIQYYGDDDNNSHATTESTDVTAGETTTIKCTIDHTNFTSASQIAIQAGEDYDGTLVINSAIIKAMEGDYEVEDLDIDITDTNNITTWGTSTVCTVNDDGSISLTYYDEVTEENEHNYGAYGWVNWSSKWNVSEYDRCIVTYENLQSDVEGTYLQLIIQDGNGAGGTVADEGVTGTIEYVIADFPNADYTQIAQIVIQATQACTVTIKSVKFVKDSEESEDEEESGDVEAGDYFVNLDFEEGDTGWTLYDNSAFEISSDTNVTPGMDGYHFLANYGNNFTADTDLIHQTSQTKLPAGTYTVSARINVGGNMSDIQFYAHNSDSSVDTYLAMSYNSADWESDARVSIEVTLTEEDYLTIGIRTGADYPTAQWLWLIADNFKVEAASGDATGITDVEVQAPAANGALYNIAGQRVAEGTKGLLIKNGKKVLVK